MDRPETNARRAIISAFNRLVLATRRTRPPVKQLLREAGVARSTLYSHFNDRDSLLLEAMGGPLSVVADAAVGAADEQRLVKLLEHFWDQRRGAQDILIGPLARRVVRELGQLVAARDTGLNRDDAVRIADSLLGFVRLWISGETPSSATVLARKMIASAAAQRAALA
jgi:AcrR family transcriptional regulator